MLPAVCGSVFPAQSCWDAWLSGIVSWWEVRWIWLMRQNFIAQFIQLWSIGCMTCHQALLWIGPILLTGAGCRRFSFQCISLICQAYFSGVLLPPGFRKLQWVRWVADHQAVTMTFSGASLALESALELPLSPITGCCIKPTFHHISQSNQEMVPCCWVE